MLGDREVEKEGGREYLEHRPLAAVTSRRAQVDSTSAEASPWAFYIFKTNVFLALVPQVAIATGRLARVCCAGDAAGLPDTGPRCLS